jgi:carbamoyltransferase
MDRNEDIIGLHYGHDATVVLLRNGKVIEAMSEERLSRQKKHIGFPRLALEYMRRKYTLDRITHVFVVGEQHSSIIEWDKGRYKQERESRKYKPDWFLKGLMWRWLLLRRALVVVGKLRSYFVSHDRKAEGAVQRVISDEFPDAQVTFVNHHVAHLWATVVFFPEYGSRRSLISLDGEGDGLSGMIGVYEKGKIEVKHRFSNRESIGLLYSSVVDVLGMARNEHEFKVMGLAPYAKASAGEKAYKALRRMLSFDSSTMSFRATVDTRNATSYLVAHNINTVHRFDSLAYGIQKLTEETTEAIVRETTKRYTTGKVALSGGVFMNVKANQCISEMSEVTELTVTPSCGDESIAIGAAVYGYSVLHNNDLGDLAPLTNLYLGSEYDDATIKRAIDAWSGEATAEYFDPAGPISIEQKVGDLLADNQVVGRMKGRAEWGARALGNRSILANPSSRSNVKLINEMIKGRDFWMPFATSILQEDVDRYIVNPRSVEAPYMAITFETTQLAHEHLPAALHPYDLTSRPQVVTPEVNPEYYALISHFKLRTGIGGVLNTSFNLHGDPNVETPGDALYTFERSGLRHLALGNYLLSKKD